MIGVAVLSLVLMGVVIWRYEGALHTAYLQGYADGIRAGELRSKL